MEAEPVCEAVSDELESLPSSSFTFTMALPTNEDTPSRAEEDATPPLAPPTKRSRSHPDAPTPISTLR